MTERNRSDGAQQAEKATGTVDGHRADFFRGHDPVGVAALLLSVFLALISGFYVLRNAEIVVQPPDEILLFRDGSMSTDPDKPDPAVLFAAIRLPMINLAAEEYGDLLDRAWLRFESGARFPLQALIEPTFRIMAEEIDCPIEARCVALPGLLIRQFFDVAYDIPGGSANARMAAFPLHSSYCEGPIVACGAFDTYRSAVDQLSTKENRVFIDLTFVRDGEREVACVLHEEGGVEAALTSTGWFILDCDDASVTGASLL